MTSQTFFSAVLMGLSLALDAFAVSLGAGLSADIKIGAAARASFLFGFFQFLMPVVGWFAGKLISGIFVNYIRAFDHWAAFALLAFVGLHMVLAAPKTDGEAQPPAIQSLKTLLALALATSLDALAVGLSYSMLGESIFDKALVIGFITFLVCAAGFALGKRARGWTEKISGIEKKAAVAGGLVIIGIGLKILLEHLFF